MIDTETRLARIAYINAEVSLFNARIEAMKAENMQRQHRGESLAFTEQAFHDEIAQAERVIGHNAVIEYLMHG